MMIPGAFLAFASWAAFNLVARTVWPLLGIGIGPDGRPKRNRCKVGGLETQIRRIFR